MAVKYIKQSTREIVKSAFIYPAGRSLTDQKNIILEIGPGRGDFLFHLCEKNPEAMVVAIEIKRKRVDRIIARAEKRGTKNLIIIQNDARAALPELFSENQASEIHIQFPDPWPKKRHAKNRPVSKSLLLECKRILAPKCSLFFVTDSENYAEEVKRAACVLEGFSCSPSPKDIFPTLFAMKWREMGKKFHAFRFEKE